MHGKAELVSTISVSFQNNKKNKTLGRDWTLKITFAEFSHIKSTFLTAIKPT